MLLFDRVHTISYSTLTETTACVDLAPFSRYNELFVENCRLLPTPPAFGAPVRVTRFEIHQGLSYQKSRFHVFLCLAVLLEFRLVTDKRSSAVGCRIME